VQSNVYEYPVSGSVWLRPEQICAVTDPDPEHFRPDRMDANYELLKRVQFCGPPFNSVQLSVFCYWAGWLFPLHLSLASANLWYFNTCAYSYQVGPLSSNRQHL